ncbi:MAG: prepilin peptidase [Geminicoccaceae bacterium]
MSVLLAALLLTLLALAAWSDLRLRRIPNALPAAVAALWLVAAAQGSVEAVVFGFSVGAALLLAGIAVWRFGWLGGGDVKLIAALGLWAGPAHLDALLLGTGLAGGGLALASYVSARLLESPVFLYARAVSGRLLPAGLPDPTVWRERALPYGVAVAVGGGWLVHRLLAA